MLCVGCNWHEKNPAPQARRACGFNPRRGMGAGSACRASPLLCALAALTCGVRSPYGKSVRPIISGGFYGKRYTLCKRYLA